MRRSTLWVFIGFFAAFLILPGIIRALLMAAFGLSFGLAATLGTLITAVLGIAAVFTYAYRLRDRMSESTFGTLPQQNTGFRPAGPARARTMRLAAISAALVLGIGIVTATLTVRPTSTTGESAVEPAPTEAAETPEGPATGETLWQGSGLLLVALALGFLVLGVFVVLARLQAHRAGVNTAPPPSEQEIIDFFEAASRRAASHVPPPSPPAPPSSGKKLDWHQLLSSEDGNDGDEDSAWWADRLSEDDERPN